MEVSQKGFSERIFPSGLYFTPFTLIVFGFLLPFLITMFSSELNEMACSLCPGGDKYCNKINLSLIKMGRPVSMCFFFFPGHLTASHTGK